MADFLHHILSESEPLRILGESVKDFTRGEPLKVSGLRGSLLGLVTDKIFREHGGQILVITDGREKAEGLRDDCAALGETEPALFVHAQHHPSTLLDMTGPVLNIEALRSLISGNPCIVAASVEAVASHVPAPDDFRRRLITIEVARDIPFQDFLQTLAGLGFERKDFVEGYGDMAVRGGIIDVFPFVGENPLRIEMWGDRVESIREFDARSQRSIRPLGKVTLAGNIYEGKEAPGKAATILDYLQDHALILLDEPPGLQHELQELRDEGVEHLLDWEELQARFARYPLIVHSSFHSNQHPIDFQATTQPPFNGSIRLLLEDLVRRKAEGYSIVLTGETDDELNRLRELVEDEMERTGTRSLEIRYVPEALHGGFLFPSASLAVFTEHEIFGRVKRRGTARPSTFKGLSKRALTRLHRGDFVVHTDYGIGKFAGLQTIKVGQAEQEVMKVTYEENDALYVNLNFVNRVQKYSSREGHEPRLTRLGTPQWDRLKTRARKRVKDIARDLIALYAKRKNEPSFAFSPDSHWQKELEASFMYEDTPDQAKATSDVKRDMMHPAPMDRLICGDVGFGKTEVAVRAAFKAVLDGKQVAVLVPTTILAHQHQQTFMDRLQRYTVRVESLTRFRSKKDQKSILDHLGRGNIDILIGTHRLLSKDVHFKNLGLLVVDEEHRFGVTAKEKLRQLKASVDTLTLTATPIPRTLQFSLMGARDLSIINTPPRNRLPIVTEIAEFDPRLLRESILREIHRGGQVYVIHDRIHTMEDILQMLKKNVPEARVHAAHGQMKGHELEGTMMNFLQRKYDVLVCTKIIESGIDIPTVNTIIINRADRFGLAELYQLRGRVGRSNVQAYAYLLTPPLTSLPRETLQRLQAIQEFTELGSGFNLAMRDMEIRGAGNLLGAEQSGFILEMGFEMYQKVVEEAVRELKEEEFQQLLTPTEAPGNKLPVETVIETDAEAVLPDVYIESDSERLDVYRRLYQMSTLSDVQEMKSELKDRFGEYPPEVEHLFASIEVRISAMRLGLPKIQISQRLVILWLPAEDSQFYDDKAERASAFQTIVNKIMVMKDYRPYLRQEGKQLKLFLRLPESIEDDQRLNAAKGILDKLLPEHQKTIHASEPAL